ncbi:vWA domain-containing protein [Paenarthrobacter ilicis]|uniref:Ca-activated chloride channel family protein n=1 Tax=Paenarthrobacter ilicis TaxID=43665 RepID=A0ABX0TGX1_9MICC|nr:VWA domain-containing protein [Paenarthrobacter ilicis]MBM7793447.1 Ca-activated chloride channel family protein [Paenarthrobacter ilicis]NIJ01777.1 Ca-activated chloride channel family protein [Paenarthrobacter ilicis]
MTFMPVVPWPVLAVLMVVVAVFTGWLIARPGGDRSHRPVRATVLRGAAVVVLLLALLRPGFPGGNAARATTDLDVFFVVDTSTSMAAEDYRGNGTRLSGVKEDVMAIAKELAGAKFSLITFDSQASVRMPLTRDSSALQTAMTTLEPQRARYATGSSVTAAAKLMKERLQAAQDQHAGRPALVFYAGDGEATSSAQPEPLSADNVAGGAVLGYGTSQGGRMKESSDKDAKYVQDRTSGNPADAVSIIDESRLHTIADQLHLPYAHRTGTEPTTDMLGKAQPAAVTATDGEGPGRVELYWLLALAAFGLAVPETLGRLHTLRGLARPISQGKRP